MDFNVVGTLIIPIGATCFKNVCEKCHLPSLTNRNVGYCCQVCKCMVSIQFQPHIAYKIKHVNDEEFDCTLCAHGLSHYLDIRSLVLKISN
jgi:hypothetical protein